MLLIEYLEQQLIPNCILVPSAWAYTWNLAPPSSTINKYQKAKTINKYQKAKTINKYQKIKKITESQILT